MAEEKLNDTLSKVLGYVDSPFKLFALILMAVFAFVGYFIYDNRELIVGTYKESQKLPSIAEDMVEDAAAQFGYYTANKQSHYTWHTDVWAEGAAGGNKPPRKLSMVLQLTGPSEFEGGQLQVKASSDEPTTLELKRGRAWFFPSYVLHQVTPVTRGTRKSLVLWVTGPEFK